jgi:hypothetical protein
VSKNTQSYLGWESLYPLVLKEVVVANRPLSPIAFVTYRGYPCRKEVTMAKLVLSKTADDDGWKPVTHNMVVVGHVMKVGDDWRVRPIPAKEGQAVRELLGFKTSKSAVAKVGILAGL